MIEWEYLAFEDILGVAEGVTMLALGEGVAKKEEQVKGHRTRPQDCRTVWSDSHSSMLVSALPKSSLIVTF